MGKVAAGQWLSPARRLLAVALALVFFSDFTLCPLLCMALSAPKPVAAMAHAGTHQHGATDPFRPASGHEPKTDCLFCGSVGSAVPPPSPLVVVDDVAALLAAPLSLAEGNHPLRWHGLRPEPRAPPAVARA